ncbi:hypothetical protein Chor_005191 [Crotalus horridus]
MHSQFVKLNEAYNVLSKERSRRDYDAQQTLRKAWPGSEAQRPSARDPFDPLHVHRQQRSGQQAWEALHLSLKKGDECFKRSWEETDGFESHAQIAKLHTGLMNERDHMISQALIKAKEQGRARHKERLQQKRTPVLQEDPTKPQDSGEQHAAVLPQGLAAAGSTFAQAKPACSLPRPGAPCEAPPPCLVDLTHHERSLWAPLSSLSGSLAAACRLANVIRFLEVYNRSICQPKETMVSVTAEHPSLGSHIMIPSCVALSRCTGCCSDDSLNCVPRRSREVILEMCEAPKENLVEKN